MAESVLLRRSDGRFMLAPGTFTLTHKNVDVTTSSTAVLSENTDRKYALIINDSIDTDIYLKIGSAAEVSKGIRIVKSGGSFEMRIGVNLSTAAVYAIHGGTGNKTLLVTEGF